MTEVSFSAKKKERVAMKRRYQIDQQRAVQQFRQFAREQNPNLQMIFPMAEVVGFLALHSPDGVVETGLLFCHAEKKLQSFPFSLILGEGSL
jgi:hypothetical protein